jgi:hypothetical protein
MGDVDILWVRFTIVKGCPDLMCFMIDLNVTGSFAGSGAAVIGTSSAADPAPTARTGSGAEPQRGPARKLVSYRKFGVLSKIF